MVKNVVVFNLALATTVLAAGVKVTASEYGKNWPFKVNEGMLACNGPGLKSVTFSAGGITYAVNGGAMARKKYADLDKIWLPAEPMWIKDPQTGKRVNATEGNKKSIADIMDRGLRLCHE